MKTLPVVASIVCGLTLALPLQAHRTAGLLQASLVEVLPTQVAVEVTLNPGTDIAPRMVALLDRDGDGSLSRTEGESWAAEFLKKQSVSIGGRSVPLVFQAVHATPLSEMASGHSLITVLYTATLGSLANGQQAIVCSNHYEPFESTYQCNGLVPKSSGVRIASHHRADAQRELTLNAEFPTPTPAPTQTQGLPPQRLASLPWILGLSLTGMLAGTLLHHRTSRKPA